MRVSSIQPNMYKSTARIQHQNCVSCKSWKGARKGAATGAAGLGTLALIGLGACTGVGLIAVVGGILGAVAGSEIEDDIKANEKEKRNSDN